MSIKNQDSVKEWIAVVTTGPTNPQTVNVVRNTLGEVTLTRIEIGNFQIQSDGLFTPNNTTVLISPGYSSDVGVRTNVYSSSVIQIQLWGADVNPEDTVLQQGTIEVKVYNEYQNI